MPDPARLRRVPRQERSRRKLAQVLAAADRLLAEEGVEALTTTRVAAEAGVSVGMVQHYFSTKDEMLLFALRWVGEELGARMITRISALPEPRDPYEVIRITLTERLPSTPRQRTHVQALVFWLGRVVDDPAMTKYLAEGTRVLRDHLAAQVRLLATDVDAELVAEGLLAFADGLSSHVLQNLHTPDHAVAILTDHLNHVFPAHGRPAMS